MLWNILILIGCGDKENTPTEPSAENTENINEAIDIDKDGVVANEDCDDNDPTITNTNVDDADCDTIPSSEDCDDNDSNITNSNVDDVDCDTIPHPKTVTTTIATS